MKIIKIVASMLMFLSFTAYADPVIQRADIVGNEIAILGSWFRTKPTPAPQIFDNFESGVVGQRIPGNLPTQTTLDNGTRVWDGTTGGGYEVPVYSSVNQRPGSTKNALADMNGIQWNKSLVVLQEQKEYFASWWCYYENYGPSISRNTKPWVMYGNVDGNPHAYGGWGNLADSSFRTSIADSNFTDTSPAYGPPDTPAFYGKWIKYDVYLKQSDPNVANGAVKVWVTEPTKPKVLSLNRDPVITRGTTNVWREFTFVGAYLDSDPTDRKYRVYADDFYFDNTQARVELGNGPTYYENTIIEPQPATAWSDNQIKTTLNRGALQNGPVFLYVTDSAGMVNIPGYPLTLGGTTPPNQSPVSTPTNLKVN